MLRALRTSGAGRGAYRRPPIGSEIVGHEFRYVNYVAGAYRIIAYGKQDFNVSLQADRIIARHLAVM